MAQERLTMRKIREIIRLKYEAGLSDRAIAGACKVSNSTVGEYLRRAKAVGLSWPLPDIGEDELYRRPTQVLPSPSTSQQPDRLSRQPHTAGSSLTDALHPFPV
jgi:hypothetical protein